MTTRIPPAQIVVVDDRTEEEALPLLKALFRLGFPALYYTSLESELPLKPLSGVRLLFLDLRLGFAGTTTRVNVTAAASVVRKLIPADNGPYILVAWTKHLKEMDDLLPLLHVQPSAFVSLNKTGCISQGVCQFDKVMKEIQEKLSTNGPVELLLFWECLVANASASTVNEICRSAPDIATVETLLYQIAAAGLGQHIKKASAPQVSRAALDVITSLVIDSIQARLNDAKLEKFKPLKESTVPTEDAVCALNSKLMLGRVTDKNPYPGNVYADFQAKRMRRTRLFLQERIPVEAVRKHVKPQVNESNKLTISRLSAAERDKLFEEAADKFRKQLLKESPCVFLEATPVCDHAQVTWKKHRIIPGFLLKNDLTKLLFKGANDIGFFVSEPLSLAEYGGNYVLILDFRGLETMAIGYLADRKPAFRIRQDFLFDIQHRAGTHSSRPGIVSLRV